VKRLWLAVAALLLAAGCDGPTAGQPPAAPSAAEPGSASPSPAAGPNTTLATQPTTPAAAAAAGTPAATPHLAPACADDAGCYTTPAVAGSFDVALAPEVSGLAASVRNPGVYYLVDDPPGTTEVVAVEEDGTLVARLPIAGMDAANAEALAVGACGAGDADTCLYVGDIGDHVGRPDVVVLRVREPALSAPPTAPPPAEPVPAEILRLTYPEAPTDAEALLVDAEGRPLLVSKAPFDRQSGATGETRLYRAPAAGGTLEDLGAVPLPEPRAPLQSRYVGNTVTGADKRDDRVILRTYDQVVEFLAPGPGTDLGTFPAWPSRQVPSPPQLQSEAIAYRVEGCGYLTAAEGSGELWVVGC
jgi:hypothetical protein